VYDGNSQGAIMGGAFMALSPDAPRGVLGVPGMNYSTLLNRGVDWKASPLSQLLYGFYPDKRTQQLLFALMQMLWDRAEANGYAYHMTSDPLPNTPRTPSWCTPPSATTRSPTFPPRWRRGRRVPS
jgi:hypothetical protein